VSSQYSDYGHGREKNGDDECYSSEEQFAMSAQLNLRHHNLLLLLRREPGNIDVKELRRDCYRLDAFCCRRILNYLSAVPQTRAIGKQDCGYNEGGKTEPRANVLNG
jgi:hypothetical protein